ncbi:MAG: tetratricopeptide repeat protein [Rhodocyclaceae bacterium]|nr:tetratricopeptide repeat protein [Rhodocyclaceae bacterium]
MQTHIAIWARRKKDLGQLDKAIASYRRALEINPEFVVAFSNYLFALNSVDQASTIGLTDVHRYGQLVSSLAGRRFVSWRCERHPMRLRIGIVSGDLCQHPVGNFLESVLSNIDRNLIELIAYPTHTKLIDRH